MRQVFDWFLRHRAWTVPATVALVVRIAVVLLLAGPTSRPIAYEHGAIAENLLAGRGFSVWFLGSEGPTSQQAPFLPLLLAACYAFLGVGTSAAHLAFQFLQCVAGAAVVPLAAAWVRRMFPDRPASAVCVAWCAALFPPHVYMATHIQAAVWSTLAVVALLYVATPRIALPSAPSPSHVAPDRTTPDRTSPIRTSSYRTAALLGLLAGWAVLVDPILALVAVAAGCGWIASLYRSASELAPSARFTARLLPLVRPVAIGGLVCAAVVGPWIVRNHLVHGEFVFVKSTFGYAFWQGNNERSWGTDKIPKLSADELAQARSGSLVEQNRALWEARHETLYIDDVLLKPEGYREFAGLCEPARSRLLMDRAKAWIADHPADYARLSLARLGYFLTWDPTNPKASHPVYQASTVVWLVAAGVGLVAARRHWSKFAPAIAAFAAVALFHAFTITSARFRIPIEPIGMIWGVVGIFPAVAHVLRRARDAWRTTRRGPPGDRATVLRGPHSRPARRMAGKPTRRAG